MPRQSFIVDLRFDGGRQAEQVLESIGQTGDRSMSRISNASQPARRGLLAVDDASRAVRGSVDELADRLGPLGSGMRALGPAGAAAAAGIAATAGGLATLAQRAPEATRRFAELGEQADQLGVGVQALQELRFAASQVGVEESRLEDGLQELNSRLGELRNEAGPLNSALEDLGAVGLQRALRGAEDTEEAFNLLVNALRDGDSTFDNAALAAAAFGEEAGRAIQRLAGQDLPGLRQEFRDLGVAIDEDLVRQSQEARGELSALDQRIQNNVDVISTELIPAVNAGKEAYADFSGAVRDAVEALKEGQGLDQFIAPSGLPGISPFNITGLPGQLFSGSDGGGSADQARAAQRFFSKELNLFDETNLPPGVLANRILASQEAAQAAGLSPGSAEVQVGTPRVVEESLLEIQRGLEAALQAARGGGSDVPTPGTRPDFDGSSGATPGGASAPLSFAGVDFNDPFTLNDAIRETSELQQEVNQQIREQAEAWAEAEEAGGRVVTQTEELRDYLGNELSNTFDRVGDELTRSFVRGEQAAVDFGNIATGVLSDIAQQLIRLSVINPLQNELFGTDRQTLAGAGGLIDDAVDGITNLFTSGGGATQTPGFSTTSVSSGASGSFSFADGGSFTVNGAFPSANAGRDNRLVSFFARDGERVNVQTPEQQQRRAGDVNVQIINQGQPAAVERTERRVQPDGKTQLKVFLRSEMKNAVNDGSLDKPLETNFGLSRQGKR